jgi:hypothetical protein
MTRSRGARGHTAWLKAHCPHGRKAARREKRSPVGSEESVLVSARRSIVARYSLSPTRRFPALPFACPPLARPTLFSHDGGASMALGAVQGASHAAARSPGSFVVRCALPRRLLWGAVLSMGRLGGRAARARRERGLRGDLPANVSATAAGAAEDLYLVRAGAQHALKAVDETRAATPACGPCPGGREGHD